MFKELFFNQIPEFRCLYCKIIKRFFQSKIFDKILLFLSSFKYRLTQEQNLESEKFKTKRLEGYNIYVACSLIVV